jgi:hypothetical protein
MAQWLKASTILVRDRDSKMIENFTERVLQRRMEAEMTVG